MSNMTDICTYVDDFNLAGLRPGIIYIAADCLPDNQLGML